MKDLSAITTTRQPGHLLRVRREVHGHAIRVRAIGELDLHTAPLLERHLRLAATFNPASAPILADVRELSFCAAAGVTVLQRAHAWCAERSIALHVVAGPLLHRVLRLTGSEALLPLCADRVPPQRTASVVVQR